MKNFNFLKDKKIIVTGHTGFKGSWLVMILHFFGAKVYGFSLKSDKNSLFKKAKISNLMIEDHVIDIKNYNELRKKILRIKPDFIFHLAAQALVKKSFEDPLETISTNIIGTANILEIGKSINKKCVIILITSDKCYKNLEQIWGYKENDELGGSEAYSASKASCEIIIKSYFEAYYKKSKFIRLASVRAGNVIGGGDMSDNRIIPDCFKAWSNNRSVKLKNPLSTRPWQHVLEPLFGYVQLSFQLFKENKLNGHSFNFGPNDNKSINVIDLVKSFGDGWHFSKVSIDKRKYFHEQNLLKLDCTKAFNLIGWQTILSNREMIALTREWYLKSLSKKDILKITFDQIKFYHEKLLSR